MYRTGRWFRRRLTPTGHLILASMGASLVVGINTRLNLASQIFALLLPLLLLSVISSVYFRPRLRVQRILPPCATVGEAVRYTLRIENCSSRSQRGLCIIDELADTWPTDDEFLQRNDPNDQYRNPFDRFIGYPRWLWLVRQKRGAILTPVALPRIPARQTVTVTVSFTPQRRGYLYFQRCRINRPDPLGIINACVRIPMTDSLIVLPQRYAVNNPKLPGVALYQPGGIALAAAPAGGAEEFVALRDYRPGDSLRTMHWKSWAKMGKPIVKEYRPEYFTRHALILDTFVPRGGDSRLEAAISVAASFLCTLETQDNLLDLLFVGSKLHCFTAGHGLDNSVQLLKILACVTGTYQQTFATLQNAVLGHARQFSGCIVVLLNWDQARRQLVQNLRGRHIQTLALVITDGVAETIEEDQVVALPMGQLTENLRQL
jgi:uncharacterized protein (DUF58 family)